MSSPPPVLGFATPRRHWLESVAGELSDNARTRILTEARHFHERFNEDFVEGRNLCPYARPGRVAGATTLVVRTETVENWDAQRATMHADVCALAADTGIEVAQWVYPFVQEDPLAWERRAKSLVNEAQKRLDGRSELAVAAFHPELPFSDRTPATLVPLFRRSPDPMIQLVRLDALRRVRGERDGADRYMDPSHVAALRISSKAPTLSVAEVVANRNAASARAEGIARLEAALRALSIEAHTRYAALAAAGG